MKESESDEELLRDRRLLDPIHVIHKNGQRHSRHGILCIVKFINAIFSLGETEKCYNVQTLRKVSTLGRAGHSLSWSFSTTLAPRPEDRKWTPTPAKCSLDA